MDWTEAYSGVVVWVSPDKTTIKVKTSTGVFTCENEGFRAGDEVMFILDPASKRIFRILPKDVALMKIQMVKEPLNQLALLTELEGVYQPIEEEVDNDQQEYCGSVFEKDIDWGCDEIGEDAEEWYDFVGLEDPFGDTAWDNN